MGGLPEHQGAVLNSIAFATFCRTVAIRVYSCLSVCLSFHLLAI